MSLRMSLIPMCIATITNPEDYENIAATTFCKIKLIKIAAIRLSYKQFCIPASIPVQSEEDMIMKATENDFLQNKEEPKILGGVIFER